MPYQIKRKERVVETQETLGAATKAFWILTAQELKNDRVADYTMDTRTEDSVRLMRRSELPAWAADVLAKYDLLAG